MCGICGSIGFDAGHAVVKRMNAALTHRGPDNDGYLDAGSVQFGMRRLKIIDLESGDQPIFNEDGSIAVVLNGEIYNFQTLYTELRELGHHFRTKSDTEVIVHAYEEWGGDCLAHLRGMFAFALYDQRAGGDKDQNAYTLFLARDRLGIKPLYLWREGDRILFSSEVRSLLASGIIPRELNLGAVYTYLAFGSVQEPLTMIDGITSLAPGSWMTLTCTGSESRIDQGVFWKPDYQEEIIPRADEVYDWLFDAISSHLISDVPLGAFLSGGIDSGAIVALASQFLNQPLKTFTLGFDNWPADERDLAQLTSQLWKTDHQLRIIDDQDLLADLPNALISMDQPTMDGVNSWYVSREAKKAGLTVALSGVGGDELFAGYPSFRTVPLLKRVPHFRHSIYPQKSKQGNFFDRADSRRKVLAYVLGDLPVNHPYFAVRGLLTENQLKALFSNQSWSQILEDSSSLKVWRAVVGQQIKQAAGYDGVGEVSWLEISHYMRSTLLRDTDMMSMAHSLEVRVPFLDHFLVEKVLAVKGQYKLETGQQKPLMTRSLVNFLPPEIISASKRTFTFPFQTWLKEGLAEDFQYELVGASGELQDWLNPAGVEKVWQDFKRGYTNWARPWSIYVLKKWIKNYL